MRFTLALQAMCHSVDRWLPCRLLQLAKQDVENQLYHSCCRVLDLSCIDLFPQRVLKLVEFSGLVKKKTNLASAISSVLFFSPLSLTIRST